MTLSSQISVPPRSGEDFVSYFRGEDFVSYFT